MCIRDSPGSINTKLGFAMSRFLKGPAGLIFDRQPIFDSLIELLLAVDVFEALRVQFAVPVK